MVVWAGDHLLDENPLALFSVGPPRDLPLGTGHPARESVPQELQVLDAYHSGPARSGDTPVDTRAGEGRGEELTELPFQPGDLPPELTAHRGFVDRGRGGSADSRSVWTSDRDLLEISAHPAPLAGGSLPLPNPDSTRLDQLGHGPQRLLDHDLRNAADLDSRDQHPPGLRMDTAAVGHRAEQQAERTSVIGDHEGALG